jgi:ribonuclease T2
MWSMLDLMPARGLIFHEWDRHGTCSGLEPREYFNVVRKARARVKIPSTYTDTTVTLRVTPHQVVDAFVDANEGLTPTSITIDCDRTRLREVRICLSRDLNFRECSRDNEHSCRTESLVMPPVRGSAR